MIINPVTLPDMVVCRDCGDALGPFHNTIGAGRLEGHQFSLGPRSTTYVQRGACPTHIGDGSDSRWARFDYNRFLELCNCCGAVPLLSGSRWSVWFCDACKQQVGLLNGRHGRCVVPIGRHSVHAGFSLKHDQLDDPLAVEMYVSAWNSIADVMSLLNDWRRTVVRRNLEVVGAEAGSAVPLTVYVDELGLESLAMDRFREMCEYLDRRGREASRGKGAAS